MKTVSILHIISIQLYQKPFKHKIQFNHTNHYPINPFKLNTNLLSITKLSTYLPQGLIKERKDVFISKKILLRNNITKERTSH